MGAPDPAPSLAHLHAAFMCILPRIELHAQIYFRGVRCPARQADAVQETLALAWRWFVRLVDRGKDPLAFPVVLAAYAARAVRCGRRLCGQEKGKDALSSLAQQRHGFAVEVLTHSMASTHEERCGHVHGQWQQDALEERLRDNTQTPVPEQVCFRLDFPAWLRSLTARERRLVREMANNERTLDLSKLFDLSPARISQLRRELHNDWRRFLGDAAEPRRSTGAV
ncbi:MAG TPA: hypothetical protein VFW33_06920 [Gemmataceae bacterium]|nr:hypothetical protein [Gemmataceae bacterium]